MIMMNRRTSLEICRATEETIGLLLHEEGKYLLAAMYKLSRDCSKLLKHLINEPLQLLIRN